MSSEGNFLAEALAGRFLHFAGKSKHSQETFCRTQERFGPSQETFRNLVIRRKLFWSLMKVCGCRKHMSHHSQAIFRKSRRKKFDHVNFKIDMSSLFDLKIGFTYFGAIGTQVGFLPNKQIYSLSVLASSQITLISLISHLFLFSAWTCVLTL